MNDENKIGLSIEMYEDLKETLVKAIKNAKTGKTDGSIHSDNAQTERIERLIEATELSQAQITHLLERLQRHTALPGVKPSRSGNLPTDTTRCWHNWRANWGQSTTRTSIRIH